MADARGGGAATERRSADGRRAADGCGQEEAPPRRQGAREAGDRSEALDSMPTTLERRRGRERNGRPVGRYLMAVQVRPGVDPDRRARRPQPDRALRVSRPADDVSQIHGNIYLGRVQNVLPGMEAAFVDIGTPKNAVLYRGDVQYDAEDIVEKGEQPAHRADAARPSR